MAELSDLWEWPVAQLKGFAMNVWLFIVGLKPDSVLPPSIVSTLRWLRDQVPRAFGLGTRNEQITSSIVLTVVTFLTGFVTGGLAWLIIAVWVVTFLLGTLRLWPFIDDWWMRARPVTANELRGGVP